MCWSVILSDLAISLQAMKLMPKVGQYTKNDILVSLELLILIQSSGLGLNNALPDYAGNNIYCFFVQLNFCTAYIYDKATWLM